MKGLNKKEFPYILAKDIEKLLSDTSKIMEENSDILAISYTNDIEILLTDKDPSSNYYFRIHAPHVINSISHFNIECFPASRSNFKVSKTALNPEAVHVKLSKWIELINSYNEIIYSQNSFFEKIYENEFYEAFNIVDEDANTTPFDLPKQLFLDRFLAKICASLEERKDKYDVQDIINETEKVREEITTSTKKSLIRKISSILSKIRIKGLELTKDVLKDYLKDGLKAGLNIAFEATIRYINSPQ